ncbi:MAG: hypothetical protein R2717_06650 [Schumannella sp.]|nr:hypothetical protein [Microbacteriaceae bacterium]
MHTLRAALPGVWIGVIGALGFIETPLKFLAPGVTTPIALGIGRLVLTAADLLGVALLIAITIVSLLRPRVPRAGLIALGALWVVLLAQVAIVRPLLNARTDIILAGGDPGESALHVVYIVADLILLVLLVAYLVVIRPRRDAVAGTPGGSPAT